MGSSPSIHDVNAESAEHIAVVIQISILSNQSLFVVNLEDVLRKGVGSAKGCRVGLPRRGHPRQWGVARVSGTQ